MDEVHAIEFDLEDVPTAEVGSLLSGGLGESGEFQRVDDGGSFVETMPARLYEIEAAHVRDFVDEIADESSRSVNFQRVSDEEQQDQSEADENEADHVPPTPPNRLSLRHWWRVTAKRELPTEQKVRDILRSMKARGVVDFAGDDSWTLRRK